MKAKRLKEILQYIDDDMDIFIRNSFNPCGNIADLYQIEIATYGFFGIDIPCVILNTFHSKDLETDMNDDIIDFVKLDKSNKVIKFIE